jgi:hypothetical protein
MLARQVVRSLPLLHGCTQRLAERRTEVSKKISDILPKTEILAQLAEEASELAQAALKLRRALDGTNPTPKSVAECEGNLMEEFADISNAVNALCDAWFGDDLDSECEFWDAELEIEDAKYKRWLSRLEAKEQSDE